MTPHEAVKKLQKKGFNCRKISFMTELSGHKVHHTTIYRIGKSAKHMPTLVVAGTLVKCARKWG